MAKLIRRTAAEAALEARVDHARLDATSAAEIEAQMREDGDDPEALQTGWHPSPLQVRQRLNLTQQQIAALLNVPVATWRNWEQGRTSIDAPGRTLLTVLAREPEAVMRAMQAG